MLQSFTFSPIQENTYVYYCPTTKQAAIIDPGCYFDNEKETLQNFISTNELKPIYLLNTHCHLDHVYGNKWVNETFNLLLHMHKREDPVLDYAPTSGLFYNTPFDNYLGERIYLEQNQIINIGELQLKVLEAPGHSPGHVIFYAEQENLVISGDVLFNGSIGRTDLPGGDFDTLAHSIRTVMYALPDNTVVHSGHGPTTTIKNEKLTNPYVLG
jgi:hydroxyacylglutathione hydrolase